MVNDFLKEDIGSPAESKMTVQEKLLNVNENILQQESVLDMSIPDSNIEQIEHLSDNDFISFLSSIAESGFTFRQFQNVSSWLKIEARIVKISMFDDLQFKDYQENSINNLFSMMHSLVALQYFWKKMDSKTQQFLENITYEVLKCFTIYEDSNYQFLKLMSALSSIRISYNEFSRDTKEIFKKMLTKYLNTCYQQSSHNFSISSFLYQLQKMGFQTSELDSVQTKIFKKSLMKMISRSKKSNFSKLLNCLSNLGFQWQYVDINFRDALEKQLQLFLVPLDRDDTSCIYSAKEVSSLFVSFSAIGLTWKNLTPITQTELINIITITFPSMIPREMSSILRSMGKIGMSWNNDIVLPSFSRRKEDQHVVSNHHHHHRPRPEVVIINSFVDNVEKMTGWDLVGCLFGFGQLGVSYEMLFDNEAVVDNIVIKSKYLTSFSVSELMLSIGRIISHSDMQSINVDSLENGSLTPLPFHPPAVNQKLLDFLQKLTIKWTSKMNSNELSIYLLGLILLQRQLPSLQFPISASDYWLPYFSYDTSHRQSTLPSELFRKGTLGSEKRVTNSITTHSLQPQQIDSREASVSGDTATDKPASTSNDATAAMKSLQNLQSYLHALSSSDFLSTWSQLGKFGITLKTVLSLPELIAVFQDRISSMSVGTTSTTALAGGYTPRTSMMQGHSLERSVQMLLGVLTSLTSLQSTWSKLPAELQETILVSLSSISEAYSRKVAQRAGLLFPLPPSPLDEDVDGCLRHIGRLQVAATSLRQDQTRDILLLCQLRLTDAKSAATVASAVTVLGNLRRRWDQEFHEFELSFPAIKYLIIARAEDFMETASCRELAAFLIGLSRIDAFRWYYLPLHLRNSLVESMFSYMFDAKDNGDQDRHHPDHQQFVDIYALTLCITSIEDMDGLRYFSKRQGDRLMLFLSRYADELDENILMKIVPRLRSIPTRNRRMLSYLCRRVVGILITNDAVTSGDSSMSSGDGTPITAVEFIALLRALSLSHDELPILASLSEESGNGKRVLTTRSTIQDSELRQHIVTVFGKLMRGLQPSEALLAVQLLASLGIRWEEFSASRRQSCFQMMTDMQQLLPPDDFTALQENVFGMASAAILAEWQSFKDSYFPQPDGHASNSDSQKEPSTDVAGGKNAREMVAAMGTGNEAAAPVPVSTASTMSNVTYCTSVSAASTEPDMSSSPDCWSSLEDLRGVIPKLKSHNLANTLHLCVRSGYDLTQLQVSGVWGLLDERIGESVDGWAHSHSKLSMLLNALDKLRVKQHQISQYTMLRVVTAITQQLPAMSGRAVSNVLYYMARLKWNIHSLDAELMRRFVATAKMSFFRTCSSMDGQGEFCNALFAASNLLDLSWSSMKAEQRLCLQETVVSRGSAMTMKDLLVLITALRILRLRWESMPREFSSAIQEKFIELTGDSKSMSILDDKSTANLIHNLGAVQAHWSRLSPLFRVSLTTLWREKARRMTLNPKDLHHIVVGLAGMNMEWSSVPESLRAVLLLSLSKSAEEAESLPVYSFIGVLGGLVRLRVDWSTLSMQTKVAAAIEAVLVKLFPLLSDELFLDAVTYLDRLSFPWNDVLAPLNSDSDSEISFSNAYTDRLLKVNVAVGNGDIALTTFKHFSQKMTSLFPVKFVDELLLNVFLYLRSHLFHAASMFSALKAVELPPPGDWSPTTRQGLLELVDSLVREQGTSCKLSAVVDLLDGCRRAGLHWCDLAPTTQYSFQKLYDESSSSSSSNRILKSNPIPVKKWLPKSHSNISHTPTTTATAPTVNQEVIQLQQTLVEVLASMGLDGKQARLPSATTKDNASAEIQRSVLSLSTSQHSEITSGSAAADFETYRLLHGLYLRLPGMKDSDLLKVLYLVGQKGVPRPLLISSGVVEVLDGRIAGSSGDLSPGTLIATITWLSRLKLKTDDLPRCIPILIRHFSTSASLLHSKTLTVSLHSLFSLGVSWKNISVEDRIGLVAGVARAASTCPQELGLLLLALHMVDTPWDFLYERIQNILRLVLARVFRDVITLCKRNRAAVEVVNAFSPSDDTAMRCAYVRENGRKVLKYLGEVGATWDQIGEKATLAILKSLPVLTMSDVAGVTDSRQLVWQSLHRVSQHSARMKGRDGEDSSSDAEGMLSISVAVWEKLEESERTIIQEAISQNLL